MRSSTRRRSSNKGVTLIEACTVTAICAVSLGVVAPSFQKARERHHLEGIAAQLENDIMFTRSLAVARNQTLRLRFAGNACYVVHTGTTTSCSCNASGSASCSGSPELLRVVRLDATTPITLQSNSTSMAFDAVKGTVTPTATIQVQAAGGAAIREIVNIMGRVRSCSPAPGLPGQPLC